MEIRLKEATIHKYIEPVNFTEVIIQMIFKAQQLDHTEFFVPKRLAVFTTGVPTINHGDLNLLVKADIFLMPITRKGDPVIIGLKLNTIVLYDYYPEELLDLIDISEWKTILKQ